MRRREVLWELYEFNFRFDLLIVDSQLANNKWKVGTVSMENR